jgi:hypothetical protein
MGALNQLGSAASSFVSNPVSSVSNALAQADKDLSLSKNAPLIAAGTAAYFGAPYLTSALGGGAGAAGAATGAYDMGIGLNAMTGGAGAAGAGAGAAGLLSGISPLTMIAGGALASKALGGSTPSSSTASTSIDPDMKAAYLQQLQDARTTAANLRRQEFAGFTPDYASAEAQMKKLALGGAGQVTTDLASLMALKEAGYTPQQILAASGGSAAQAAAQGYTPQQIAAATAGEAATAGSQGYTAQQIAAAQANRAGVQNIGAGTGAQYMSAYQNPFEQQVVQGALGDIERQRQLSQQAQQARAVGAKAFGGSRQAVAESLANEDYTRRMADTAAQLRSAGFTTAAGLGQTDAARALQAQMANQGVDLTLEQANAQLRQQGMMANQAAGNQASQFGAGAANQAALANQAAINQMRQYNAQLQQTGLLSNQAAGNQALQFGAGASNQANLANAAAMNQMGQFNAQLSQQAALANQSAFGQAAGLRQGAIGQMGALGAQQQNLGLTGAQAMMNVAQQRQALDQARMDADRNLRLQQLGITGGALGQQLPNLGSTTTSPIYRNQAVSGLGGALGGAQLGSILGGAGNPQYAGYGAILGGLLGLG